MNRHDDLDQLLEGHAFEAWEWSADGTATWQRTDYVSSAYPLTTRACIVHDDDGGPLTFQLEHDDFRGPFYTKPLDHLDLRELDNLLDALCGDEEDD